MHFLDKLKIKYYHHQRIKMFSNSRARVQGWRSQLSQQERFQALCAPLSFSGKSVLDLGCGYGDLKRYIDDEQQHVNDKIGSYLGIDQQSSFIKSARKHFINQAETHFMKADFSTISLPKVDIIIASGSLNYRNRQTHHLQKIITAMYEASHDAVAFNLLDNRYFTSGKLLVAYDALAVLRFCRSLCANSQLFDGYAHNDFTIVMQRESG